MKIRTALQIAVLAIIASASIAWANINVRLELEPKSGTIHDTFTLSVTLEGEIGDRLQPPIFENNEQFRMEPAGTSTSHEIINGKHHQSITYSFLVHPDPKLQPGSYRIPPGKLLLGRDPVMLKQPTIKILKVDEVKKQQQNLGVDLVQLVSNTNPYVGQQILYRAEIASTRRLSDGILSDIDYDGFWRESLGDAKESTRQVQNRRIMLFSMREALFPAQAGELIIPGRTLTGKVQVEAPRQRQNRRRRGILFDFFPQLSMSDRFRSVQKRFYSDPLVITARALPTPPKKGLSYIPVGKVSLRSSIDRTTLKQGESVTLQIELSGDANLRPYELSAPIGKDVSAFKSYIDKPAIEVKRSAKGVAMKKTLRVAFVPLRAGELVLPSYEVVTFDPDKEQYQVQRTKSQTLSVIADKQAEQLLSSAPQKTAPGVTQQKRDITVLGEDLLPQHVGSYTFRRKSVVSPFLSWGILLLLPLATLFVFYRRTMLSRLAADPLSALQKHAYTKASDALSSAQSIEQLTHIVKTFIGEQLKKDSSSFTTSEVVELVEQTIKQPEIAARLKEYLSKLQQHIYSGQSKNAAPDDSLISTAKNLIDEIHEQANH